MGDMTTAPGRPSRKDSTSRLTLTWGGAGVALASLFPLLSNVGLVFPGVDVSWFYTNTPLIGGLSGVVLLAAFAVLAVGVRGEAGIAGPSVVGKTALIVFAMVHATSTGYFVWPTPNGDADAIVLSMWTALVWGSVLVSLIALMVAAAVVFRAGVVGGAARWALPAFALMTVVALVAGLVVAFAPIWIGALVASQLLQLVTGVLYIVEGRRSRRASGLRPASV